VRGAKQPREGGNKGIRGKARRLRCGTRVDYARASTARPAHAACSTVRVLLWVAKRGMYCTIDAKEVGCFSMLHNCMQMPDRASRQPHYQIKSNQTYFKEDLRSQWCPSVRNEQEHIFGTYLRPHDVSLAIIAGSETSPCEAHGSCRPKIRLAPCFARGALVSRYGCIRDSDRVLRNRLALWAFEHG
jgi:hypothetical protein